MRGTQKPARSFDSFKKNDAKRLGRELRIESREWEVCNGRLRVLALANGKGKAVWPDNSEVQLLNYLWMALVRCYS